MSNETTVQWPAGYRIHPRAEGPAADVVRNRIELLEVPEDRK